MTNRIAPLLPADIVPSSSAWQIDLIAGGRFSSFRKCQSRRVRRQHKSSRLTIPSSRAAQRSSAKEYT